MFDRNQAATHAAVMELKEERMVVSEAYNFLDEKRLLLAAELLRQLEEYESLMARLETVNHEAHGQLAVAMEDHGLQGMQVYPPANIQHARIGQAQRNFMGVTLVETAIEELNSTPTVIGSPSYSTPEAEKCRGLFHEMIILNAQLAGCSGNLYRLANEYRLTERRARALENVILPEISHTLKVMTTHLEELDLEDAIRARLQGNRFAEF